MLQVSVLNDGFVRLVDVMGDDAAIADSARISYGAGTKKVSDDAALIRYLMRHRHTTPFEMVEFKFHVRVPMDCWRQWIRHRTASVNEYSTRYSEAIDSTYVASSWRAQDTGNRQGSSSQDALSWPGGAAQSGSVEAYLSEQERELHDLARRVYNERLACGVAREQARKDLPLSTYTEAYWKIDLHNLLHFLSLRLDARAQHEIRMYAQVIGDMVAEHVPLVWEAFVDYRLDGMVLSASECAIVKAGPLSIRDPDIAPSRWFVDGEPLVKCRERDECEAKLMRLGL